MSAILNGSNVVLTVNDLLALGLIAIIVIWHGITFAAWRKRR